MTAKTKTEITNPDKYFWLIFIMANLSLILTVFIGLFIGIITAYPTFMKNTISMQALQPLHTLLALSWIFGGIFSTVGILFSKKNLISFSLSILIFIMYAVFLIGSVLSGWKGNFSGREYLTWSPILSVPLFLAFIFLLMLVLQDKNKILKNPQEPNWLLLVGLILCPLGLLEGHLYLVRGIVPDIGTDLTLQWHALDTFISGWCIILYSVAMLITKSEKPFRNGWLYMVALIGILLDFGHHNYISPQPHYFKIIGFSATMLAIVSFFRHIKTFSNNNINSELSKQLRHVEFWTLFAVSTGILLAIPQINLYTHGTYAIVAHTMGSIIGVNSMIIIIAGFQLAEINSKKTLVLFFLFRISLILFCLLFFVLGIALGILRVNNDILYSISLLRPFYILIPIFAIPLSIILSIINLKLISAAWKKIRKI